MTPRHRPPVGLRLFIAVVGISAVGFNAALMLSDRAPGALRRIGGGLVVELSERIDAGGRTARLTSDPRLPSGDTLVHIGVWGTAMLFVGLAVWSWRGLAVGAASVLGCSVAVEIGQRRYTTSRVFEVSDIVANAIGVAIGAAAAAGCYLLWSGVVQLSGARPRADTG